MRHVVTLLTIGVAVGCHTSAPLSLPADDEAALAAIVAVENERGARLAYAFVPPDAPSRLTLGAGTTVVVAYYDRSLEALGLAPGAIELADGGDEGRPFPLPRMLYVGRSASGAAPEFDTAGADHESFVALRRPSMPVESCYDAGGCYARPDDIDARVCTKPCSTANIDPPERPIEAAVPTFGTCPSGWTPATELGLDWCDPPPRNPACTDVQAQWIDATSCVRVGSPCPAGDWSPDISGATVVYVRDGAVGGVGSRTSPYGTIAAAIAQSSGVRVIALTAGTYDEAVVLEDGIEIHGACAENTTIQAPNGDTIQLGRGRATLRNVHVAAGSQSAIEVFGATDDATLVLRDVRATGDGTQAIVRALGRAEIDAETIAIRGRGEAAVLVGSGASATLTRLYVEANAKDVWATGPDTNVEIRDSVFVEPPGVGQALYGVHAGQEASIVVTVAHFAGHRASAFLVDEAGQLEVDTVYVEDTERGPNGAASFLVSSDGRLTARRVLVRDTDGAGVGIIAGTASLTDVIVIDPRSSSSGVYVSSGGDATLDRVALVRPRPTGLFADGVGTVMTANDVVVLDTLMRGAAPDGSGVAMAFEDGATFEVNRARIERATAFGVLAYSDPGNEEVRTRGVLADISVSAIGPRSDVDAVAFFLRGNVDVTVRKAFVSDVAHNGLTIANHAVATLEDVVVEDAVTGFRSYDQASVSLLRARFDLARAAALCVASDSVVTARHIDVTGLGALRPVDDDTVFCAFGVPYAGSGVVVNNIATLDIDTYAIRGAPGVGISIRGERSTALRGTLEANVIGMQIAPEVTLDSVLIDTTFSRNDVSVDRQ